MVDIPVPETQALARSPLRNALARIILTSAGLTTLFGFVGLVLATISLTGWLLPVWLLSGWLALVSISSITMIGSIVADSIIP